MEEKTLSKNVIFETCCVKVELTKPPSSEDMETVTFTNAKFELLKEDIENWYTIIISNADNSKEFKFSSFDHEYKMNIFGKVKFCIAFSCKNDDNDDDLSSTLQYCSGEMNQIETVKSLEFMFDLIYKKESCNTSNQSLPRKERNIIKLLSASLIPQSDRVVFEADCTDFQSADVKAPKCNFKLLRLKQRTSAYSAVYKLDNKVVEFNFNNKSYTHKFHQSGSEFRISFLKYPTPLVICGTMKDSVTVKRLAQVLKDIFPDSTSNFENKESTYSSNEVKRTLRCNSKLGPKSKKYKF